MHTYFLMWDQTFGKNTYSKQHNGDSHPSFLLGPLLRATTGLGGEKGKKGTKTKRHAGSGATGDP